MRAGSCARRRPGSRRRNRSSLRRVASRRGARGEEAAEHGPGAGGGGGGSHRGILRTGVLLGCLVFARWEPTLFVAGLAVFVAGLAVRLASKGYLRRRARVVAGGPY